MHSGVAVAGRAGCGCCWCWVLSVAGRGLFDDGGRSAPSAPDGGRSADIASACRGGASTTVVAAASTVVDRPPRCGPTPGLAVTAGPAGPAHDPCCDVGDDARVRHCRLDLDRRLGRVRASGWAARGRSGHRRCRGRDGGRCTPATRRRDVGRSTTVWGGGADRPPSPPGADPLGACGRAGAAGIAGPSTLVTIPTPSTDATT